MKKVIGILKKSKSFIVYVLSVIMILSPTAITNAAEYSKILTDNQRTSIIESLRIIEPQKGMFGMEDTDFYSLDIGEPIQTYNYVDEIFEKSRFMYPILDNSKLVALAISNDNATNEKYQITTELVKEINNAIDSDTPFTLVYDQVGCYVYTSSGFNLLIEFPSIDTSRSILEPNIFNNIEFDLTSFSNVTTLGYFTLSKTRAEEFNGYWFCDVNYVSQNNPSNICWAAVIATIANSINGTSLTAVDVAKAHYGTNYDQGLNASKTPAIFLKYGLKYTYRNYVPSIQILLNNIKSDYPIYGSFASSASRHAVTIYGVNTTGADILIMNPVNGVSSAYKSNGVYSYVSTISNNTFTLDSVVSYIG